LLDGRSRADALAVADEIAAQLQAQAGELVRDGSLASGSAGLAVAFAYLDQVLPGRGYGSAAADQLDAACDFLADAPLNQGLYGGFTGIAWAASRVDRMAGRPDDGDQFSEIDELLADMLSTARWEHHYDLIDGLAGVGVYALERLPHAWAERALARIIDHLERWAERLPGGVAWRTPVELLPFPRRAERPQGEYNLGLAHGAPGAIALLAQAAAAGVAADRANELVDAAVP
jgi:lantibiotic modifying enzyme